MNAELATTDPLRYIQEAVQEFLLKSETFGALSACIVLADRGDVFEASKALVAKLGLAIVIEPVQADISFSGSNTVITFDDANPITIIVWENVPTNRSAAGTGRRASELAIAIAKHFRPGQTPAAPCAFVKAVLRSDSSSECIYTLSGRAKLQL